MKRNYLYLAFLAIGITMVLSCKKPEIGYLSSNIFYTSNPLQVPQGSVFYSASINADQSSAPLTVKLLAIRNKLTGEPADDMLKNYEISTFTEGVTDADSTLALLNAKITKSLLPAFRINEIGGRLEFTAGTSNIDTGTYVIDVQVTNSKGTMTKLNACDIHLIEPETYSIGTGFASTSPIGLEADFVNLAAPVLTVTRVVGEDKIIIKIVDGNGVAFNPSNNEVVLRGDRGNFAQMNPYYPVVKTTTAMEWGFPVLPNGFPIKQGSNGTLCYYRIPGAFVTAGRNVNVAWDAFKVKAPGTYTLTVKMTDVFKKP